MDDVNWTALDSGDPVRIVGSGTYSIGSPDPITVVQHRMELDLQVGDEPVQHFDGGWVPLGSWSRVTVTGSINGIECYDTMLHIRAEASDRIFSSGFEGGDLSAWPSGTGPGIVSSLSSR